MAIIDAALVAIHIPAGLIAVVTGVAAMLSVKGSLRHRRSGLMYLGALAIVASSGVGLVLTRGPGFFHLLLLGALAVTCAATGYVARARSGPAMHIVCMGASYIAMLTAFYVDNGPKLPLWNRLPPEAFWFLPSLVGVPLVLAALQRHAGSATRAGPTRTR